METVTDLLGPAAPTDDFLRSVVRDAVAGRAGDADPEVSLESVTAERVPYDSGSPATGALVRLRGMLADGTPWSVFVKLLQNPRHWVHINRMPPPARAQFIADFPWRSEVAAWEPDFAGRCRPGCACRGCTGWPRRAAIISRCGWRTSTPTARPGT